MRMLRELDAETQLLFAAARPDVSDAELRELLDRDLHYGKLVTLARRERATVPLWNRLADMKDGPLPEETGHLQSLAMVEEFRQLHMRQLLVDVLELFAGREIDALLLKGGGLAVSLYPRFVDRPMWDLDILVRADRAEEAWTAMVETGWKPAPIGAAEDFYDVRHHHLQPLDDPQGVGCVLEIHRGVLPGDTPFAFPAELIWEGARPIEFEGYRVFVPRDSHQVVHLSAHFAWSHMMESAGWRTFRDLAWLVQGGQIDWDEVVDAALKARAGTCAFWTLRLARSLLAVPIPDHVLLATKPPGGGWRLDRLERAFAFNLTPYTENACPSVSLFRWLWRLGIRPRWSGHVGDTPWDIVEHGGDQVGTGIGTRSSIAQQFRRLPNLARFASATLKTG